VCTGVERNDADCFVADDDVFGFLVTPRQDPLPDVVGYQTRGQKVFWLSAVDESVVLKFNVTCEIFGICILELSYLPPHGGIVFTLHAAALWYLFGLHHPAAEFELTHAWDVAHVFSDLVFIRVYDWIQEVELNATSILLLAFEELIRYILYHTLVVIVQFDEYYFIQSCRSFPVQCLIFMPYLKGRRGDYWSPFKTHV